MNTNFTSRLLLSWIVFTPIYINARTDTAVPARVTQVNQKTFIAAGATAVATQYTISSPGYYQLTENIPFTGSSTPFNITSGDVTVDLNGYTLSSDGDESINAFAVSGVENVTIKNGTITGFDANGINVAAAGRNIKFQDLTISNGDQCGIYLQGSAAGANAIKNCIIENCTISDMAGDAAATGIQIDYGENIIIKNCNVFDIAAASGSNGIGIYINTGTGVSIENCYVSAISGDTATGCKLVGCNGCFLEDTDVTSCFGAVTIAAGFHLSSTCKTTVFKNCSSIGNEGQTNGYGFYQIASNYSLYDKCYARNCRDFLGTSNNSSGFFSDGCLGTVWNECISTGNQTANDSGNRACGFEVNNTEKQGAFINCIAQANGSLSTGGKGYGFFLNNATKIGYMTIMGCRALTNCSANNGYGFYDASTSSTNMFVDNFAFGNSNGSTTDNYNVTLTGTFPESEASTGGISGISAKPIYYNVSITT